MIYGFNVKTSRKNEFINITRTLAELVSKSGVEEGLCTVFVPHTTAGVTINENADPNVVKDMLMELSKIAPENDNYLHEEGNSAAHIKSSLMGSGQTIIIKDGKLMLGVWQGVYLTEFDGPRNRSVTVRIG